MAFLNREKLEQLLELCWWLLLASGVGLFVAVAIKTLLYPHEVAVSEGAVGLAAQSLLDGVPLYDPSRWREPPYVIVHYTPLYYLMTAPVLALFGPGFAAGRLVSSAATLGTAVVAAIFVYRRTGKLGPAIMSGAIWLSFYQVVFWGTIQRVDAPGILFEAVGLLVYVRAREGGKTGYGAIPWFVAAWATKQVMAVGLLACIADLLIEDRGNFSRAWRFAAAGFGPIFLIMGALMLWSDGGFWTAAVLGTVSQEADPPWVIFSNAELFFGSPWNMFMLVLSAWLAWLSPRNRFLGIYLGLGMVIAIATDANLPRFFPPMLAMAIMAGILVEELRSQPKLRVPVLAALAFFFTMHQLYEMRSLVRERILTLHEGNERLWFAEAVKRHTSPNGAVLAQDVGMLLSAERPVIMADPLVFSILRGNNAWEPDWLVENIENRSIEAVILNRPVEALDDYEWTTLWIAPAKQALEENYRLVEEVTIQQTWRFLEPTRYVYVPKAARSHLANSPRGTEGIHHPSLSRLSSSGRDGSMAESHVYRWSVH